MCISSLHNSHLFALIAAVMYIRGLNNWAVTTATLAWAFIILDDLVVRIHFLIYKVKDHISLIVSFCFLQKITQGFPGGAVVKNLPASAGDTGSSPGPGRSHMPQSS